MNDMELYSAAKLAEIPHGFLQQCVDFLRQELSDETQEEVRKMYAKDGAKWCIGHHFGWGMAIRNALREAGLKDDQLPDQNWDDYYVPVVEVAVGIRTVEGIR